MNNRLDKWLQFSKNIPTTGMAALAVIRRNDGKVLAVSREHDRSDFGLPGGKCEPDEDFLDALKREVLEETGVTIEDADLLYEGISDDNHFVKTYLVKSWSGTPIETTWEGEVRWVAPMELTYGCFSNYNTKVYEAFIDTLINESDEKLLEEITKEGVSHKAEADRIRQLLLDSVKPSRK